MIPLNRGRPLQHRNTLWTKKRSTEKFWLRPFLELCVVCVGQKRHAPPPLLAALAFSPLLLAASGRHSMGDDSPWSSVSPPGLPATQFPQCSALSQAFAFRDFHYPWVLISSTQIYDGTSALLRALFLVSCLPSCITVSPVCFEPSFCIPWYLYPWISAALAIPWTLLYPIKAQVLPLLSAFGHESRSVDLLVDLLFLNLD